MRMVTQTADRTSPVRLELRAWTCLYRTWFVVSRVATHMPIALWMVNVCGRLRLITLQDTRVFVRSERCEDALTSTTP